MTEKDILDALNAEWKEVSFLEPTTGSPRTMVVLVRKPAGAETSAPQQAEKEKRTSSDRPRRRIIFED